MRFVTTPVVGATIVELESHDDARGTFSRTFCEEEFARAGIDMRVVQTNISRNPYRRTMRGMHYQTQPHGEPKIVHCVRGRIFDVAVDLRPESPSYCRWAAVELFPDANRLFYIPRGCAHGFLTLEDESDIVYLMGAPFVPGVTRGLRWNDPAIGIVWPAEALRISEQDAKYSDFSRVPAGGDK